MEVNNLFRQEVIINQKNRNFGFVFINLPIGYKMCALVAASFAFFIVLFIIFAQISEKFVVKGYLNSNKGIIHIYPRKNGVITDSFVMQGSKVKKGDKLFLINTTYGGEKNNNSSALLEQLLERKNTIDKEILYKKKQILSLKYLLLKKFISLDEYNRVHEEFFTLKNNRNLINIEIIKQQQDNFYIVRAPVSGIVSSIIYKRGQYTNLSKPLITLLPKDFSLIAELFIPVHQAGFLHKNNKIIIHYDAYPYQRFGTYTATIQSISANIFTDEDEEKPLRIGQPYYKVTARLERQSVMIYGKEKKIQQGMTLTAVIVGSKRKIWQWILDPLYSFYGELFI